MSLFSGSAAGEFWFFGVTSGKSVGRAIISRVAVRETRDCVVWLRKSAIFDDKLTEIFRVAIRRFHQMIPTSVTTL